MKVRKLLGLLCILALCLNLTACSAEDMLVDILSKAIAKAMEESVANLSEEATDKSEDSGIQESSRESSSEESSMEEIGMEESSSEEGTSEENQENPEEAKDMSLLYEYWAQVVGYWNAAEACFAVPDMMDSHTAVFSYGIYDTEAYSGEGKVTELYESKKMELTASVYYAAQEANELHDAVEERTVLVVIDYSGLDQDGKIRIKIGEDDWKHYMFAGNTSEEAYQTYWDNTYGAE